MPPRDTSSCRRYAQNAPSSACPCGGCGSTGETCRNRCRTTSATYGRSACSQPRKSGKGRRSARPIARLSTPGMTSAVGCPCRKRMPMTGVAAAASAASHRESGAGRSPCANADAIFVRTTASARRTRLRSNPVSRAMSSLVAPRANQKIRWRHSAGVRRRGQRRGRQSRRHWAHLRRESARTQYFRPPHHGQRGRWDKGVRGVTDGTKGGREPAHVAYLHYKSDQLWHSRC